MIYTENNNINCRLDLPYPPAQASCRNQSWARLLYKDYAGSASEMTAICQYTYQNLITEPCFGEVSSALSCIASVEMQHLHLLGELIVSLGGDPQFRSCDGRSAEWWQGGMVSYCKNLREMLLENIAAEENAVKTYRKRIAQISDQAVQRVLERIILDEEYHIKIFKYFLCRCR